MQRTACSFLSSAPLRYYQIRFLCNVRQCETVLISCQTSAITSFTKINIWQQMLKYVIIIIIIIIIISMC